MVLQPPGDTLSAVKRHAGQLARLRGHTLQTWKEVYPGFWRSWCQACGKSITLYWAADSLGGVHWSIPATQLKPPCPGA